MALQSRIESDCFIAGTLRAQVINLPANTVDNAAVGGGANIQAEKLEHSFSKVLAQDSDATAVSQTRVVHVVRGTTGDLVYFEGGVVTPAVDAGTSEPPEIEIDLLVNGTSILATPLVLDSANTAYTPETGVIDTSALVVGDVIEIQITTDAGGGTQAEGVFASVTIYELPL